VEGGSISVLGAVRNTGDRDDADVVQVYAQLPDPEAPSRLIGFVRCEVPAGQRTTFDLELPTSRLATRDPERRTWRAATGPHRVIVGRFAGDPHATEADIDL
jgi:beta-glucosidase